MIPELAEEQAFLVARAVRLLALVGIFPTASADERLGLQTQLERWGQAGAIPFVLCDGDELHVGYGATRWAIELYGWLLAADVPITQKDRIRGLLHGYGASAIRRYEEAAAARLGAAGGAHQPPVDGFVATAAGREGLALAESDLLGTGAVAAVDPGGLTGTTRAGHSDTSCLAEEASGHSNANGASGFHHAERALTRYPPNVEQITVEYGPTRTWLIVRRNDTELRFPLAPADCEHLAKLLTEGGHRIGASACRP